MKKILTITLLDGKEIKRDITLERGFPFGAPANSPEYMNLCSTISANGYTDATRTNDRQYTHIAPSQIKTVDVTFE